MSPTADSDDSSESKSPQLKFSVDDAFTEGDDYDIPNDFSTAAFRAELVKSLSHINTTAEEPMSNGGQSHELARGPDASVSTIDINGSERLASLPLPPELSRTSPNQSSYSLESLSHPSSSQFSPISLSDNPIHDSPEATDSKELHPYPNVHIEILEDIEPHAQVVHAPEVGSPLPSPSPSTSTEPSRPQSRHERSPHSSAPSSAASFTENALPPDIPTSASAYITPSLSAPTYPKPGTIPKHRATRSIGPSALDRVVSRTRPTFLPPKPRDEDSKHLALWEHMMKESRAIEIKKRKEKEERRLAREQRAEESIHIWEEEVLPDWRVVNKKPPMRKLWWRGIPMKLRARMWERALGNALALSKDNYRTCLARAKRALAAGTFPTTTLSLMDEDIRNTLPTLHLFHPETGAMYGDLKDMLCAWVVSRSDERLGYTMGISRIAAMFVLNMPLPEGFVAMRNLLERHCMRSFYGGLGAKADLEAYYRIFDTLLADAMPKIYFNFKQHHLSPAEYLFDWLITLFLDHLELSACAHIWDVFMLEGDSFLFRTALALLSALEPRLFFPDRKELLELLKGENKAAVEVAKRQRISLDGPKYDIYGLDEEVVWDKIESMDDWWKDNTWIRLLSRELPDL